MKRETRQAALAAAVLACAQPNAHGFEWNAAVGFGVWQSDNETRSSTNELDETTLEPVFAVSAAHDSKSLLLNASYRIEGRDFLDDIVDDATVVTGSGELVWNAIPERFDLTVRQNSTEGTLQRFARGTQDNRQEVSTTEAAPRLRFRTRNADEIQFEYRYRQVSSELTNIDSQAQDLVARYNLGLSERTTVSLEFIDGNTEYDAFSAPDIDRTILQGTVSTSGERTNFSGTLGNTLVERRGRSDTEGITGNLLWFYEFNPENRLTLSASREISDGSEQFFNRGTSLNPFVPGVQVANTDLNEIFTAEVFDARFSTSVGANTVELNYSQRESDFERLPRDEEFTQIGATVSRRLRRTLTTTLNLQQIEGDFVQLQTATFEQRSANLVITWEPIKNLETSFRVLYSDRDGAALAGSFDELRFYIGFTYRLRNTPQVDIGIRNR